MSEHNPDVLNALESLIKKKSFEIHFQPILAPSEGRIVSVEALCRFEAGLLARHRLSVAQVVQLLEQKGVGAEFDLAVIDRTLTLLRDLKDRTGLAMPVSINLCASTLGTPRFVTQLKRQLLKHGMEPARLQLEIGEAALVDREVYQAVIPRIVEAGVGCAIDNFISGHTDFGMLTSPLVKTIKVDRVVTASLADSEMARRFVRGLLMLVESTNKRLVMKGVETREQLRFLDAIGCNQYQGYFFSGPMPVHELPEFVRRFTQSPRHAIFSKDRDQGSEENPGLTHSDHRTR